MLIAAPTALCAAQAPADPPPVRWEWTNAGGLHFFGPTRASIALGGGFRRRGPDQNDRSRMFFTVVEPGFGALRASAGYAESIGAMASGWNLRASVLQMTRVAKSPRYAGAEIQVIPLACLGTRIGVFRSVEQGARRGMLWLADFSICL